MQMRSAVRAQLARYLASSLLMKCTEEARGLYHRTITASSTYKLLHMAHTPELDKPHMQC
jgi:hypothetical protein